MYDKKTDWYIPIRIGIRKAFIKRAFERENTTINLAVSKYYDASPNADNNER